MPTGTVSWLSYADRLMEFPTALLGVAAGHDHSPEPRRGTTRVRRRGVLAAARLGSARDSRCCSRCRQRSPWSLATPLVATLFHHGQFTADDVAATQAAVVAYGIGLLGLMVVKILAPAFYARREIGRGPMQPRVARRDAALQRRLIVGLEAAGPRRARTVGRPRRVRQRAACCWLMLRRVVYVVQPGWGRFLRDVALASVAMAVALWLLAGDPSLGLDRKPDPRSRGCSDSRWPARSSTSAFSR